MAFMASPTDVPVKDAGKEFIEVSLDIPIKREPNDEECVQESERKSNDTEVGRHTEWVTVVKCEREIKEEPSSEDDNEPLRNSSPKENEGSCTLKTEVEIKQEKPVPKYGLTHLTVPGCKLDCNICKKIFTDINELIFHTAEHSDGFPWVCKECYHCFETKTEMSRHLGRDHVEIVSCVFCRSTFRRRSYYLKHLKKQHDSAVPPNEGISCYLCDAMFWKTKEFIAHMKDHSVEKPYQCPVCQNHFQSVSILNKHINDHNGFRPYRCHFCDKGFKRKPDLVIHLRVHTNERPFECPVCKRKFKQSATMKTHLRTHSDLKPYKCDKCDWAFKRNSELAMHYITHSSETPFVCNICNMRFKFKNYLTKHIKTHSNIRPHACPICQKAFLLKGDMKNHMRTHTNEKPFQCRVCDKRFKQSTHLAAHKRSHTNAKTYKCFVCQSAFNHASHLKRHLTHTHGIPKEELDKMRNSKIGMDAFNGDASVFNGHMYQTSDGSGTASLVGRTMDQTIDTRADESKNASSIDVGICQATDGIPGDSGNARVIATDCRDANMKVNARSLNATTYWYKCDCDAAKITSSNSSISKTHENHCDKRSPDFKESTEEVEIIRIKVEPSDIVDMYDENELSTVKDDPDGHIGTSVS